MKTALIISSSVAASRVGATASAFCLQRLGINTLVLPTTLLGRHPGWGPPGGGKINTSHLASMWEAIAKQNIHIDGIMTGYMASQDQISLACDIIKTIKSQSNDAFVLVDPVMGDHGKLYVSESIASDIKTKLIPRADMITPNVWELEYLTGQKIRKPKDALKAATLLGVDTVATSVPNKKQIGALYATSGLGRMVNHARLETIPHGGGDALSGTLLAHILGGRTKDEALMQSVASIFDIISGADEHDHRELPLVKFQNALIDARPLDIETVTS